VMRLDELLLSCFMRIRIKNVGCVEFSFVIRKKIRELHGTKKTVHMRTRHAT
jgi:hypothetical protein